MSYYFRNETRDVNDQNCYEFDEKRYVIKGRLTREVFDSIVEINDWSHDDILIGIPAITDTVFRYENNKYEEEYVEKVEWKIGYLCFSEKDKNVMQIPSFNPTAVDYDVWH